MSVTFGEQRTKKQKKIDREILDRVKRGIALLEQKHGPDWFMRINLDKLDLAHPRLCVLGQLYGDYGKGARSLDLRTFGPEGDSGRHGFSLYGDEFVEYTGDTGEENRQRLFRPLTEAWKRVLTPLVKHSE